MKLLIGSSGTKIFHLKEFGEALANLGINYKLVHDVEVYDGFPSRKISNWFQSTKKFDKLIQEFNPDAIFVDRQRHFGLAAIKAKIPLFTLLRGDYWSEIIWARETLYKLPHKRLALWKWDQIAEKCFEHSTVILPICKYLEKKVKQHYPNKPTEVLYQGISPSRWYATDGMKLKHPNVGLLQSANIWGKTKEMLTLTRVIESMPDVTFYWVGDGPYRDKILPVLSKYDNFKWLGKLEYPDQVREYLSDIDVYALISGMDMSPLTLQEAALMNRPIIATNVGGIPELMNNSATGFLIKPGDHHSIIEKISILINDKQKAQQMGQAGRHFVEENFNWDKIAKRFVDIMSLYVK